MKPILTAQQMRDMERAYFDAGAASIDLMERAAAALCDELLHALAGRGKTCVFACGTGGNGGDGYAAVRAKADTELRGYAAGYITNALENGHKVRGPSGHAKRERESRREEGRDRVAGIYMYHMTDADVVRRLTAEGAREIEKKAMAYLEGNG